MAIKPVPVLDDEDRVLVPGIATPVPLFMMLLASETPAALSLLRDRSVLASRTQNPDTVLGLGWDMAKATAATSMSAATTETGAAVPAAMAIAGLTEARMQLHYSEFAFGGKLRDYCWPRQKVPDSYEVIGAARPIRAWRHSEATILEGIGSYQGPDPYSGSKFMPYSPASAMGDGAANGALSMISTLIKADSLPVLGMMSHTDVWTPEDPATRKDPTLLARFRAMRSSAFVLTVSAQPLLFLAHLLNSLRSFVPLRDALDRMDHSIVGPSTADVIESALLSFPLAPSLRHLLEGCTPHMGEKVPTRHGDAVTMCYPDWLLAGVKDSENPFKARTPTEAAGRWEAIAVAIFGDATARLSTSPFGRVIQELSAYSERAGEIRTDLAFLASKFQGWSTGAPSARPWKGIASLPYRREVFVALDGMNCSVPWAGFTDQAGARIIGDRILTAPRAIVEDLSVVTVTKPKLLLVEMDLTLAAVVSTRRDPRMWARATRFEDVPLDAATFTPTAEALASALGFIAVESFISDATRNPDAYNHLGFVDDKGAWNSGDALAYFRDRRTESFATTFWVLPPSVTLTRVPLLVDTDLQRAVPLTVSRSAVTPSTPVLVEDTYYYTISNVGKPDPLRFASFGAP